MRTLRPMIFVIFCLVRSSILAQPICETDSVIPVPAINVPQMLPTTLLPCFPDTVCQSCDSAAMLSMPDTSGLIIIGANTGETIRIQLWDGCHYILLDTCVTIPAITPPVGYQGFYDWCDDCMIKVCANGNAGVNLTFKFAPPKSTFPMPSPILLVDTLCGTLIGMSQPNTEAHECQWRSLAGSNGRIPLEIGPWYCTECKRKILVR